MKSPISYKTIFLMLYLVIVWGCMKGSSEYDHGINETDKQFSSLSLQLHAAGLDVSDLASNQSTDSSIKLHASNTLNFHRLAHKQLDSVTRYINLNIIPTVSDTGIAATYQQLLQLQGVSFDSAYLLTHIKYYQKAVDLYSNEIVNGNNPSLVKHAKVNLPIIQKEFDHTNRIFVRYR